jgi:hypothetical protein
MTTSTLVRYRDLLELVEALDGAVEVLEALDFFGNHLALPLPDCLEIQRAIERAAATINQLRFQGGDQ